MRRLLNKGYFGDIIVHKGVQNLSLSAIYGSRMIPCTTLESKFGTVANKIRFDCKKTKKSLDIRISLQGFMSFDFSLHSRYQVKVCKFMRNHCLTWHSGQETKHKHTHLSVAISN